MSDEAPRPPQPPSIRRRLVVPWKHAVGQIVILLIVILALLGVVGEGQGQARAESEGVSLSVSYPTLIRYKTLGRLEMTIETGDSAVEDLTVVIASSYLAGFSEVSFLPEAAGATPEVTLIPMGDVAAQEELVVSGELQAERYWLHEGWIEVRAGDGSAVRVPLATFVFP